MHCNRRDGVGNKSWIVGRHYSGVGIFGLFFFSGFALLESKSASEWRSFYRSSFLVEICSPLFTLFSNLDFIELSNKYHEL